MATVVGLSQQRQFKNAPGQLLHKKDKGGTPKAAAHDTRHHKSRNSRPALNVGLVRKDSNRYVGNNIFGHLHDEFGYDDNDGGDDEPGADDMSDDGHTGVSLERTSDLMPSAFNPPEKECREGKVAKPEGRQSNEEDILDTATDAVGGPFEIIKRSDTTDHALDRLAETIALPDDKE